MRTRDISHAEKRAARRLKSGEDKKRQKVGALECDQSSTGLVSETAEKEKLREVKKIGRCESKE